jgi:hypothetical protein
MTGAGRWVIGIRNEGSNGLVLIVASLRAAA